VDKRKGKAKEKERKEGKQRLEVREDYKEQPSKEGLNPWSIFKPTLTGEVAHWSLPQRETTPAARPAQGTGGRVSFIDTNNGIGISNTLGITVNDWGVTAVAAHYRP
jgi:hypothetical protein